MFNGLKWVETCFSSLTKSLIPLNTIVVDNASTDESISIIKLKFPNVIVIENKENLGFGRANNIGIKYALTNDADFIFLLNQDAWIEPDTIKILVEKSQTNPSYGILSPVHLNGKGDQLDTNFSKCIPHNTLNAIKEYDSCNIIETNFVNAAAWLLTKECISTTGGFDPLFLHYGEDRDYCNRVLYNDFKIGVLPNAFICHDRNYEKNNPFRKQYSGLFSSGLAHLKNINNCLFLNCLTWISNRSFKLFKFLLFFDFKLIHNDFLVIFKLIKMRKKILNSRFLSKQKNAPYLTT